MKEINREGRRQTESAEQSRCGTHPQLQRPSSETASRAGTRQHGGSRGQRRTGGREGSAPPTSQRSREGTPREARYRAASRRRAAPATGASDRRNRNSPQPAAPSVLRSASGHGSDTHSGAPRRQCALGQWKGAQRRPRPALDSWPGRHLTRSTQLTLSDSH